ncbi:MAG: SOS response-associated peptidase [Burkholderiaceae bacterium]
MGKYTVNYLPGPTNFMCINYRPPTKEEITGTFRARLDAAAEWPAETWKDYPAPIIRSGDDGAREAVVGTYGIVPMRHIPKDVKKFDTMNARVETVGEKRSYSKAWRLGQTCLVPAQCFFEPHYDESKKHERWRIEMADHSLFAVAGLWREWKEEDGSSSLSFTQLTINADQHPFMKRFHKPDDEKRSLVILRPDEYDAWLTCRDPEIARSFMTLYPAELFAGSPAPKPPSKKSRGPDLLDQALK